MAPRQTTERRLRWSVVGCCLLPLCLPAAGATDAISPGSALHEQARARPPELGDDPSESLMLETYRVVAPAWRFPFPQFEKFRLNLHFRLTASGLGFAIPGSKFVFTPERAVQSRRRVVFPLVVLDGSALPPWADCHGSAYADQAGLPRSARVHLATFHDGGALGQGLGLRSPRVLLEGVPLEDPWTGAVRWNGLPREGLLRGEWTAGGAAAWGEGAGAVAQFFRLPALGQLALREVPPITRDGEVFTFEPQQVVRSTGQVAAATTSAGGRSVEFVSSQPTSAGVLQVLGRLSASDGSHVIGTERRGPVDVPAWSRHRWLEARWHQPLGPRMELSVMGRADADAASGGTRLQRDGSGGELVSAILAGRTEGGFSWHSLVYLGSRQASHTFAAVDRGRKTERLLLDEHARPTRVCGASFSGVWVHADSARTTVGMDLRGVRGESRVRSNYWEDGSNREWIGGGEQSSAGVFVMHHWQWLTNLRLTAGARLETWSDADGEQRIEIRRERLVVSRQQFEDTSGRELSPTLGAVWQPKRHWRVRASGDAGYRRPRLAQRYGWLGAESLLLEPNPELRRERRASAQASIEYDPRYELSLRASVFGHFLRDAIGTSRGVGAVGFLPMDADFSGGYERRRWVNLDRASVDGIQLSAIVRPRENITVEVSAQTLRSTIDRAPTLALEGRQLAGIPRWVGRLEMRWKASPTLTVRLNVRGVGAEFCDEENTQRVGPAVVADMGLDYALSPACDVFLTLDNLANARVAVARDATGLEYLGMAQKGSLGLRVRW